MAKPRPRETSSAEQLADALVELMAKLPGESARLNSWLTEMDPPGAPGSGALRLGALLRCVREGALPMSSLLDRSQWLREAPPLELDARLASLIKASAYDPHSRSRSIEDSGVEALIELFEALNESKVALGAQSVKALNALFLAPSGEAPLAEALESAPSRMEQPQRLAKALMALGFSNKVKPKATHALLAHILIDCVMEISDPEHFSRFCIELLERCAREGCPLPAHWPVLYRSAPQPSWDCVFLDRCDSWVDGASAARAALALASLGAEPGEDFLLRAVREHSVNSLRAARCFGALGALRPELLNALDSHGLPLAFNLNLAMLEADRDGEQDQLEVWDCLFSLLCAAGMNPLAIWPRLDPAGVGATASSRALALAAALGEELPTPPDALSGSSRL